MNIIEEIAHNVKWGQLDFLTDDMERIRDADVAPEGFDENYKETATQILETIDSAVDYTEQYYSKVNTDDIVYNRLMADRVAKDFAGLTKKKFDVEAKALTVLETMFPKYKGKIKDFKVDRNSARFDKLTDKQKQELKSKELIEDSKIKGILDTIPEFKNLTSIEKKAVKRFELWNKLNARLGEISSDEFQRNYVKGEKAALENSEETAAKSAKDAKKAEAKKKGTQYINQKDVVSKTATQEQQIQRDNNLSDFNTTKLSPTKLIQGKTFSSIDLKSKEIRQFTPGDLVRSIDGRHFQVQRQSHASQLKGNLKKLSVPILIETDSNGNKLNEVNIPLDDFSFLRPEIRLGTQSTNTSKPNWFYNKSTPWGPYVEIDSVLKPNNTLYEQSRVDKATLGRGISVRNMEYKSNWATALVPFETTGDFNFKLLNSVLPQGETIDVEFKLREEKGEGNKFVDIYVGKDIISRLDRTSNLNYGAIINALSKGPVTGKIVEKFTSKSNFVKLTDAKGNVIQNSLKELSKMDKQYLPNGTIYIAQNPGENSLNLSPTTLSETGELISGDVLYVKNSKGESVPMSIPYESMQVGSTSVLIVGPNHTLIPAHTAAKKISELPSTVEGNQSFTEDVVDTILESIEDVFPEILKDEEAWDAAKREEIRTSGNRTESEIDEMFREEKIQFLNDRREAMNESFNAKVYTIFRNNSYTNVRVGKVDGTTEYSTAVNSKGSMRKIVNPHLFTLEVGVTLDNKVTPKIKMRDESQILEVKTSKGTTARFKRVSLLHSPTETVENPGEFMELIGSKQRSLSIRGMIAADGNSSLAESIIFDSGITTDINPSQPFAGTGLTLQFDGQDIKDEGTIAAEKHQIKYSKKYEGSFISKGKTDEVISALEGKLAFNPDSLEMDLSIIAANTDLEGFIKDGKSIIRDANLSGSNKILKEFEEYMTAELTSETEAEINEIQTLAEKAGIVQNVELVGRLGSFINKVIVELKSGNYKVVKPKREVGSNPDGDFFRTGAIVYNSVYGVGTIKNASKSKYVLTITKKDREGNKVVENKTIFAHQTFRQDSKYTELSKLTKSLEREVEGSPQSKIIKNSILRIENLLKKKDDKANGVKPEAVKKGEATAGLGSLESFTSAIEYFGGSVLNGRVSKETETGYLSKIYKTFSSERGQEFLNAVSTVTETSAFISTLDMKSTESFSQEQAENILDRLKDGLMYTQGQVDNLKELASKQGVKPLRDLRLKALDAYVKHLSGSYPKKSVAIPVTSSTILNKNTGKRTPKKPTLLLLPGSESNTAVYGRTVKDTFDMASTTHATFLKNIFQIEVELLGISSFEVAPVIPKKPVPEVSKDKPKKPIVEEDKGVKQDEVKEDEGDPFGNGDQVEEDQSDAIKSGPFEGMVIPQEANDLLVEWHKDNKVEAMMLLSAARSGSGVSILMSKAEDLGYKSKKIYESPLSKNGNYKENMIYRDAKGHKHRFSKNSFKRIYEADQTGVSEEARQKELAPYNASISEVNKMPSGLLRNFLLKNHENVGKLKDNGGQKLIDYIELNRSTVYDETAEDQRWKKKQNVAIAADAIADGLAPNWKTHDLRVAIKLYNSLLSNKEEINAKYDLESTLDVKGFEAIKKDTLDDLLGENFNDDGPLGTDSYDGPAFKKGEEISNSSKEFKIELARIKKMMPQVELTTVENVAAMVSKFGVKSIGAFDKGVIYLVNNAKKGTGYHEVFHGVASLYLTPTEKTAIAKEYKKDEWSRELEETVADDFADYVVNKSKKSMGQRLSDFFKSLLDWKNNSRSSDVTSKIFKRIDTGKYAQNISLEKLNNLIVDSGGMTLENFSSRLVPKDKLTLQKLVKSGNIKIIC